MVIALLFMLAVASSTALNFMIARTKINLMPIACSASRLCIAAAGFLGCCLALHAPLWPGLRLSTLYVVVGLLTMAIPHAFIFVVLRPKEDEEPLADESLVAIVEASIVGFVAAYLLVGAPASPLAQVFLGLVAFVGLIVFVGFGSLGRWKGFALLVVAAISTAVGLILLDLLAPKSAGLSFLDNARIAVVRLFYGTAASGIASFVFIHASGIAVRRQANTTLTRSVANLVALAFIGTGVTWFSLFMLVALGELLLAAVVAVAIPVATETISKAVFREELTGHQIVGGSLVLVALVGMLI